MRRKRLLWRLFPYFLAISVASISAVSWYASHVLYRFHEAQASADLVARAGLIVSPVADCVARGAFDELDAFCKEAGRRTSTRLTVILPDGRVIADSDEIPASMENHRDRPEIAAAIHGEHGLSSRYSETLGRRMMYAAIPVPEDGRPTAVLRASMPLFAIESSFRSLRVEMILGGLLLLVLIAVASLAISRWITSPIDDIRAGAERFASGDLSSRIPVPNSAEIGALADSLNSLAGQLGERIRQMEEQRNQQAAVFSSMVEGVLTVDQDERILNINEAAAQLLRLRMIEARGRDLREVVRNPALQRLVSQALASDQAVEADVVIQDGGDVFLQAHGTPLRDDGGRAIGALIVLNDVSRIRKLEAIRRDFVANVSHELKTPITSIKGFVETLQDGAVDNREDARRFLAIVAKQADRLSSIIEDLLSLSRVEQEAERGQVVLAREKLHDVLASAVQAFQIKAEAKGVKLVVACDPELRADINPALLEQAVVNLVDNAVKYSDPGQTVEIEATAADAEVIIRVRDHGCGIAAEHLPRLFERFYRVDKSRSRDLGGTGLGLAIAKHIVQAHHGRVAVESTPGEGSVFTVHLPA